MAVKGFGDSDNLPHHIGDDMDLAAQNLHAGNSWKHIAEDEFDGMSIFGSDGDSDVIFMVLFVNVGIEFRMMEGSVNPVKEEIFTQHEENNLSDDFLIAWEGFNSKSEFNPSSNFVPHQEGSDNQV